MILLNFIFCDVNARKFQHFLLDVKLEFHKLLSRIFVFLNGENCLKQRQLFLKGGLIFNRLESVYF